MKNKLAIILDGGGMSSSYSVGVILALVEKYKLTDPDIVIAASGSAGTASYYIARQYDSIKNIWQNLLSTKKFINPFRFWKIIDIDYLIDEVFKKQDPLNANMVYNSRTDYLIAVTNYDTGKLEYISAKDGFNIFEMMRATKAMPVVYNKSVKINGKKYCDSYISISTKDNLQKAIEIGAENIIVVSNGNHSGFVNGIIFGLWMIFRNKNFRKNYRNSLKLGEKESISKNINILTLEPQKNLKISTFNNKADVIRKTIRQGYRETCENKKMKEFLNNISYV